MVRVGLPHLYTRTDLMQAQTFTPTHVYKPIDMAENDVLVDGALFTGPEEPSWNQILNDGSAKGRYRRGWSSMISQVHLWPRSTSSFALSPRIGCREHIGGPRRVLRVRISD